MKFKLSHHAKVEMERRGISLGLIESVLENPEQVVPETAGTKAYQSQREFGGKMLLLRVIVDDTVEPLRVVTAYRTSKIDKYWRTT